LTVSNHEQSTVFGAKGESLKAGHYGIAQAMSAGGRFRDRSSQNHLLKLPKAFWRKSQPAQEWLSVSMSELHETDHLR
jgi:hypothetical protein